jgi:hypothetical protein
MAFVSLASNLDEDDTNQVANIFAQTSPFFCKNVPQRADGDAPARFEL